MKKDLNIKDLYSVNGGKKNRALCNVATWGFGGLGLVGGAMASSGTASVAGAIGGASLGHELAC